MILVAMATACGTDRPVEPTAVGELNADTSVAGQPPNSPPSVIAPQSTAASSTLTGSTDQNAADDDSTPTSAGSPVPAVPAPAGPSVPSAAGPSVPSAAAVDSSVPSAAAADSSVPSTVDTSTSSTTAPVAPLDTSPSTENRPTPEVTAGGCGGNGRTGTFHQSVKAGGATRQFFVSVRSDYDSSIPNALYVGLHGRDYDGARMRDYLGLETDAATRANEIFVYPDALSRAFGGDRSIGWQNGPIPSRYAGTEDLEFIDAMIAWLGQNYCIDNSRVFATGQSWGGDFTNVLLCFRGSVFRAGVSVAANAPYYLPSSGDGFSCQRQAPIWIMHGKADQWFSTDVGRLVGDFWVDHNGCAPGTDPVTFAAQATDDETVDYRSCAARTRYSSYTAASGHQIPADWYAGATMAFFRDL